MAEIKDHIEKLANEFGVLNLVNVIPQFTGKMVDCRNFTKSIELNFPSKLKGIFIT